MRKLYYCVYVQFNNGNLSVYTHSSPYEIVQFLMSNNIREIRDLYEFMGD